MPPVEILFIDDNAADVELLGEALAESGWDHRLRHTWDGLAGLAALQRRPGAPALPDMILLDLNLPGLGGMDLLGALKADPALSGIPVIIFSGSEWERSCLAPLGLGEECFILKPSTWAGFREVALRIQELWQRETARS